MAKYVVAVSGGVDSVVLLDMLVKGAISFSHFPVSKPQLVVAHFDHGIRPESADDAKFVGDLAEKYGLTFETERQELGAGASEELARTKRYDFLRRIAKKYDATLVTAHHMDDVIESIAINLIRGTGWRGLAVMDAPDIYRPLTSMTKHEIVYYAKENGLDWHEDSTNASDEYLRNQVRRQTKSLDMDRKLQLMALWVTQKGLRREIDSEISGLIKGPEYSRYFFTHIDPIVARECLRNATNGLLTRPQLDKALIAVKTIQPSKKYHAGGGVEITFTSRNFVIELIK